MAGLLSWLFRRGRSRAVAELPPAPAAAEPEPTPEPEATAEPEATPERELAPEPEGEISPARLDAALQRLRAEHPPAAEG